MTTLVACGTHLLSVSKTFQVILSFCWSVFINMFNSCMWHALSQLVNLPERCISIMLLTNVYLVLRHKVLVAKILHCIVVEFMIGCKFHPRKCAGDIFCLCHAWLQIQLQYAIPFCIIMKTHGYAIPWYPFLFQSWSFSKYLTHVKDDFTKQRYIIALLHRQNYFFRLNILHDIYWYGHWLGFGTEWGEWNQLLYMQLL